MVNIKKFPYVRIHSKAIDYDTYRDNTEEYIIHNLAFRIDDETEWSSCIPNKKVQIENLAIEYTPEGKKRFQSKGNIWKTKFLAVTNSLTLIDCYFGTENFKAEKLKNDFIFRNIKELNLSLNEIPSMEEFEELLKMCLDLERIDFGEIRLNQELLTTILKYENVKTIYCRGVEINLENLTLNGNKLSIINISTIKDIEYIKNFLNDDIEIDLKVSGQFEMDAINAISSNVIAINFDSVDITNEELIQVIRKCSKIRELYINKCNSISDIESLLKNENLQKIVIDGKKIKEHIIIYVQDTPSGYSFKYKNKSIANYKEIDTLELIIKDDNLWKDSIICNDELLIHNLIIKKLGKGAEAYKDFRLGLSASSRIKVDNSISLENVSFHQFNKQDEIYKNTKKLITSQTGFKRGGMLDDFLSYATNIEEVEFTNQELNFDTLEVITSHSNIKKISFGETELHLEGIIISKDKLNINLDIFKDVDVILGLIEKEDRNVTVDISDNSRIADLEIIAPYIKALNLSELEITQDVLSKILSVSKNLKDLKIKECEQIQEIKNIEQYENLSSVELDGKNLLQIPGVTIKENSYGKANTMIIDMKEYNGSPIRISKFGEIKYLKVILSSQNNINDINITQTNTIVEMQIVNLNEEDNTIIKQDTEEFFSKFKSLVKLDFEKCDVDFRALNNLGNLKQLSIDNSNLNNARLRELPEICKGLTEIKINNCRNLTDVSALAQLEDLSEIDVSNNRICKGIDLLINYLHIDKLIAKNNLITNDQIKYIFENRRLNEVDLSRNPITTITALKDRKEKINIKLEGCLLSIVKIDEKFEIASRGEIRVGKIDYYNGIIINCDNNPLIEPSKYLLKDDINTFERQKNVFAEIEMLLKDLPEEEKKIEYVKACKKYYNIPKNGKIDKESKIYNAYIGTLAFMGIVCVEDDFYYYDGNAIQPVMEKNPQILLQDEKQEVGILESYLGEEIQISSNKIVNMYRLLENKPRRLEFENEQILAIFNEELKQKLPDSMFFSFADRKGKIVNMFEVPKQIDTIEAFTKKEFEEGSFNYLFGGIRIKFISQDGNYTFLHIPNEVKQGNGVGQLNEEDIQLRKRNINTLKEIINDEHFYLEQATDADIVVMEDESQEERLINFLMSYLPCEKEEIITNKTAKQELMESFNLSSYAAILTYGQHIQQEVTERLEELRKRITDSFEVEKVSCALKRLDGIVEKRGETIKEEKKKGFLQSLFRRKEEEKDNSDSKEQVQTIEQIKEELKTSAENIITSISNCKLVQNVTIDYTEKLDRYIQVAKYKLEELKSQNGTDKEQIEMLERKVQSLEISKVLAKQTCMQFELLAKTKANLFEKVCTATQLIPILASQSILKFNIDSQNDILDLNQDMYQYAQNTIINNANTLKETAERTLSGEDSIEILKSVIKSVDEIAKATKNGLTSVGGTSSLYIESDNVQNDFDNATESVK